MHKRTGSAMSHDAERYPRDLPPLVRRRMRIQELHLGLWSFGRKHVHTLRGTQHLVFHLLVGAAFALWRAAFLVKGVRKRRDVDNHAMAFLGRLAWDNAIAYAQEQQSYAWTVGYYLNDALFRLDTIERVRSIDRATSDRLTKAVFRTRLILDQARVWDATCRAAESAFKALKSLQASKSRKQSGGRRRRRRAARPAQSAGG